MVEDARERARVTFGVVERALDGRDYLLARDFTAADLDVMLRVGGELLRSPGPSTCS